jgi:hypothetical protein
MKNKSTQGSDTKQTKRTYQRPQLTLYGEFRDFTKGTASGPNENSSGAANTKKP